VLGRNILRQALTALAGWMPLLVDETFYISVNVSPRQLREPDYASSVLTLLEQYKVPANRLVLEVTESMLIEDVARTKDVLEQLTDAGVRFSLDDFGTGYSSLSQMQQLPFHQLKVDQSFVRRLGAGRDSAVVIRAILQLAEAMKLDAVAEGIETSGQMRALMLLGCAKGQGWLFSKALPSFQVAELLAAAAPQPSDRSPLESNLSERSSVSAC